MAGLELVIAASQVDFERGDHVTVTGAFDGWQHEKHILQYDEGARAFRVELPYSGEEELVFKFVLNGSQWLTVGCFEAITDPEGHVNNRILCRDWLRPEEPLRESVATMDDVTIGTPEAEVQSLQLDASTELASSGSSEFHSGVSCVHSSDSDSDTEAAMRSMLTSASSAGGGTYSGLLAGEDSAQLPAADSGGRPPLSFPGDYIHVASRGECSSSEEVELSSSVTGDDDMRYSHGSADPRPRLQGLLSVIRVFKTYWKG
ncbi:ADL094Wp [Eremothecium gossypii ATCC 10895]|uniref:ADL094Wp n=1 Tax=Eremothecium gossypii (strain ATCC 10895 / CBS 109.51 / FGSC 9923 / NRRL Y-1056) TaxID=284811 RepID=Q75AL7_EREGS|nr:ADL094Wp [Eremothecium gossypii ATCC 10895]AAS51826.1 ADL094Wp [Eremothecium gossypii ATCC 10895]AEY96123.1 FADL094Wp [Eremothecium gossypii FDAG1]